MERLANVSSTDGRMAPSTSRKKDLGVVTPLVSAEREPASFFCQEGSFLTHASPIFLSGASGSFYTFCNFYFYFVLFIFVNSHNIYRVLEATKRRPFISTYAFLI